MNMECHKKFNIILKNYFHAVHVFEMVTESSGFCCFYCAALDIVDDAGSETCSCRWTSG